MLEKDGVATLDLIEKAYPSELRRKQGAFAVIECFQSIPCNPCFSSCPKGAISMQDISDLPRLDFDKCTGCGICVSVCPGLAIFVIDESYSPTQTLVRIPHEFLPLPQAGDIVHGLARDGSIVCDAIVKAVLNSKSTNRTPQISLIVDKQYGMLVRALRIKDEQDKNATESSTNAAIGGLSAKGSGQIKFSDGARSGCGCGCVPLEDIDQAAKDAYICRCEELTVDEIRDLINKGYTTLDEIKRVSRAGMGACQGRTCRQLIMNEIAALTGTSHETQETTTFRPTTAPIRMELLCREDENND